MADINFSVIRAAMNTSTGNQSFTSSGFGTPKAAIFILGAATTDDTLDEDSSLSIGFTDGTTSAAVASAGSDGEGVATATGRHVTTDCVLEAAAQSSGAARTQASFNAWVTDGVQINITNAPAEAWLLTVILINGSDVTNVDVGSTAMNTTNAVDITSIGFEADLVFTASNGQTTNSTQANFSLGVIHNGASLAQKSLGYHEFDNAATTVTASYLSTDNAVMEIRDTLFWKAAASAFDASGFTLTPSASAGTDTVKHLALKFSGSPDIKLFEMDSPTTTGSEVTGSVGFQPEFGMIFATTATVVDSPRTSSEDGLGIVAFDGTNIFSNTASSDDAVVLGTSIAKNMSSNQLRILEGGSSDHAVASFTEFNSDGWEFNYSTAPGTASKWFALAIGSGAEEAAPLVLYTSPGLSVTNP
jgi:hypothetical protein